MAAVNGVGIPLVQPSAEFPISISLGKQASTLRAPVQGAVNGGLLQKSILRHPLITRIARNGKSKKGRRFPFTFAGNERAAGDNEDTASSDPTAYLQGGDSKDEDAVKQQSANLGRRELLWAATGTASYVSSARKVRSAPILPSDMDISTSREVPIETAPGSQVCALPDGRGRRVYEFQCEPLPLRVRRPAHVLSKDKEYIAKYNEAYKRMKALPDTDPRSFQNQWRVHCAFCNGVYPEPGNTATPTPLVLQFHRGWMFLPWHRMYLYFHERILGDLIGDPKFALPFWNWDNQRPVGANQMPLMYTQTYPDVENAELRNAIRNPTHFPPALVNMTNSTGSEDDIRTANLSLIHHAVASTTSADLFMGGAYRSNQAAPTDKPGTAETEGHNVVHRFTGTLDDPRYPDNQDMGRFVYAARDPMFYIHHANVDRLWSVWTTLPDTSTRRRSRRRHAPFDPDFLNTEFAFYDHLQRLVHVKVKDTLDTTRLRYAYEFQDSDRDWIYFQPKASGAAKPSQADIQAFALTPKVLSKDESRTFLLTRRACTEAEIQRHSDEGLTADDLEETLVVKGVKMPHSSYVAFEVFINLPTADNTTPADFKEFVGTITHFPHRMPLDDDTGRGVDFRLSIGAALKRLNIPDGESVCVTFVPKRVKKDLAFDGVESQWR